MLALLLAAAACGTAYAAPPVVPPCSLNGVPDASGACVCDAGWIGPNCSVLDLLPTAALTAATQPWYHPTNGGAAGDFYESNSWGISVARDDSGALWHGFMTCGAHGVAPGKHPAGRR